MKLSIVRLMFGAATVVTSLATLSSLPACDVGQPATPVNQAATDGSIPSEGDATTADDAGNTEAAAPVDSGGDGGFNGCKTYTDNTANMTVNIVWGFSVTSDANHCSIVKAGSTVTWTGDFITHPLNAFNGDTPNPIANAGVNADGGPSVSIMFPTAGLYGYHCDAHASMIGAILVVP